jgi:cytochrome c oxidase subunit 5b
LSVAQHSPWPSAPPLAPSLPAPSRRPLLAVSRAPRPFNCARPIAHPNHAVDAHHADSKAGEFKVKPFDGASSCLFFLFLSLSLSLSLSSLFSLLSPSLPPSLHKTNSFPKNTEISSERDLLPEGAQPGTVPTDNEQATGLERLEILGKMQGVDVFDMRPLDSSRKGMCSICLQDILLEPPPIDFFFFFFNHYKTGTLQDPIVVRSFGDEQYVGCTGCPADTHVVTWLTMSRDRPIERCPECGGVYKMEYVGPQESHDDHAHHDRKHITFLTPSLFLASFLD